MSFEKKIEFKGDFPLSGKILFEMIVNRGESDLNKYIESGTATGLGTTGMRSPAYEIVGENSDKVFELLQEYISENGKPYIDDVENSFIEPKFNKN